jgi:uncharacterized alkaline shock family protein YloU
MTDQLPGRITIAPQVLTTIVEQTALDAKGVQALGARPPHIRDAEGRRAVGSGVEAVVSDNTVFVALNVKAAPDINMLTLAETLQRDVARNIEHILGMKVARVDVHIGDVTFSETTQD